MSKSPDDAGNVVNTTLAPSPPSIFVTDDNLPDGTADATGRTTDGQMVNLDLQEVDLNEIRRRTQSSVDPNKIDIGYPIKILKTPREIKIKLVVVTLMLVIIAMTTGILILYVEEPLHFDIGHATLYVDSKNFELNHDDRMTRGQIGLNIPNVLPSTCAPSNKNTLCVEWNGYGKLRVDWDDDPIQNAQLDCYKVTWESYRHDLSHRDCYSLTNAHWYGGAEVVNQMWPIEKGYWSLTPYLTGSEVYKFGPVAERYWISSHGVAIRVHKDSPLFVSVNDYGDDSTNNLCFVADFKRNDSPYPNANESKPFLQYDMCFSTDVKTVHRNMSSTFFDKPSELPNDSFLKYPMWSTPACVESDSINQSDILQMVQTMNQSGFQNGTIEILCGYSSKDGDLDFDRDRFTSVADMIAQIKDNGFNVAVSVNPFSNVDSKSFQEGVKNDYYVREGRGEVPGLSRWDRGVGIGSLVDISNPNASLWYESRLEAFQEKAGFDYFTFDYGEAKYLPLDYITEVMFKNPCEYTTNYANLASQKGNPTVLRSVFQNQNISLILQTIPKSPTWNYDNGLKTVIPTVLTLGIVGYPYIMLDMEYSMGSERPEKELFIRWLEISAFLPVMKIPIPVWEYDEEVVTITKKWIKFHQEIIAPKVACLGKSVIKSGDPIIRPMWWVLPEDENAQNCDSQFLIGDEILVAPILDPVVNGTTGKVSRQVYIPAGNWVNKLTDQLVNPIPITPTWVTVEAALDEVPYFEKQVQGFKTPC